jgi:hypothetical protein
MPGNSKRWKSKELTKALLVVTKNAPTLIAVYQNVGKCEGKICGRAQMYNGQKTTA